MFIRLLTSRSSAAASTASGPREMNRVVPLPPLAGSLGPEDFLTSSFLHAVHALLIVRGGFLVQRDIHRLPQQIIPAADLPLEQLILATLQALDEGHAIGGRRKFRDWSFFAVCHCRRFLQLEVIDLRIALGAVQRNGRDRLSRVAEGAIRGLPFRDRRVIVVFCFLLM